MNEEIADIKPPMGFPHITDLAGSEATILQIANSQGDILGYATLDDIDAYIEQKVSETVHSFSQKQTFQNVTINGTFDGDNVVNQSDLNSALGDAISNLGPASNGTAIKTGRYWQGNLQYPIYTVTHIITGSNMGTGDHIVKNITNPPNKILNINAILLRTSYWIGSVFAYVQNGEIHINNSIGSIPAAWECFVTIEYLL